MGSDFITDQFINESISLHKDIDGGFLEAVHQLAELDGVHFLGDGGRAAHIHEEHGQLDLRAAWIPGIEEITYCIVSSKNPFF
jgi:hypothetical protein